LKSVVSKLLCLRFFSSVDPVAGRNPLFHLHSPPPFPFPFFQRGRLSGFRDQGRDFFSKSRSLFPFFFNEVTAPHFIDIPFECTGPAFLAARSTLRAAAQAPAVRFPRRRGHLSAVSGCFFFSVWSGPLGTAIPSFFPPAPVFFLCSVPPFSFRSPPPLYPPYMHNAGRPPPFLFSPDESFLPQCAVMRISPTSR